MNFFLKCTFDWASCILSGSPTQGHFTVSGGIYTQVWLFLALSGLAQGCSQCPAVPKMAPQRMFQPRSGLCRLSRGSPHITASPADLSPIT